ncbi:putative cytochrome P450 6a14 [Lycorma delicatula]|uniref:putative cytochrome P450 6a14 n=1 Tax=Lycorma delicatula TaxID=130591 RepID=UPI003F513E41
MILAFLVLLMLCLAFYKYSTASYDYWEKRSVKFFPPTPLFGNFKDVVTLKMSPAQCNHVIYRSFPEEKYVGLFQLRNPSLLIRSPELIKQILVKDFMYFTDRGIYYDEEREPLTAHLVNLEGEKWKVLRQKLTPVFTSGKLKNMYHLLQECSDQLTFYVEAALENKNAKILEMRDLMARFTTDVIGSVAFGLQFNSFIDSDSEFRRMGRRVFDSSATSVVTKAIRVFFPYIFRLLRLRTFPEEINTFFSSVVKDTIQDREKNNIQRNDFIQQLMLLRKADSDCGIPSSIEMSDSVIAAQAFVFFLAGFETSSTTLSFCLHELAVNPEVQSRALNEINEVKAKHGGSITHDAILDMEYIDWVLLETMRKYPPVAVLSRVCTKPYMIPGTKIILDPGIHVSIPVYSLHHDPQYFPNPDQFLPERFNVKNREKIFSHTYLPFGDGPRMCIGKRFAMLEMKLGLSEFLTRYKVSLTNHEVSNELELDPGSFILAPKKGISLLVESR